VACEDYAAIDRVVMSARGHLSVATAAELTGLRLACRVSEAAATDAEIRQLQGAIPSELKRFWENCREAVFFVDVDFDQWGLHVLGPLAAIQVTDRMRIERANDILNSDLVIGSFRGDSDFVILRNDPGAVDFGQVVVGLPLDARKDWYFTGLCLSAFLDRFVDVQGQKFWEIREP
jgi:hypothetical protein